MSIEDCRDVAQLMFILGSVVGIIIWSGIWAFINYVTDGRIG